MLKSRLSGSASLMVFVTVFAVLGAQSASANEGHRVFLRFAGDLIRYLEQSDVDASGMPTGTSTVGLVRARAKGNLGRADLTAVAKTGPPMSETACPDGFTKVADITDNNLVFTFSDLSLLYGDGTGIVCVNFMSGEEYAAVDGVWLGGTARFRNARGSFSIRFDEFAVVSPRTQVVAEAGTITGTIELDH